MEETKLGNNLFNLLFEILTFEQIEEVYSTIMDMAEKNAEENNT